MMSLVTFNIMFNDIFLYDRHKNLIKELLKLGTDIICLQEVLHDEVNFLINGLSSMYKPINTIAPTLGVYGVMIFVKHKIEILTTNIISIPSMMNRAILYTEIKKDDITYNISTFHLESLNNREIRAKQLQILFSNIRSHTILCGDTNLTEDILIPENIVDAGVNKSSTYWGSRFWNSLSNKRYDRVYYSTDLKLIQYSNVFNEEYEEIKWLSDHDGILTIFEIKL